MPPGARARGDRVRLAGAAEPGVKCTLDRSPLHAHSLLLRGGDDNALPATKYPRHYEILPELPKGSTGKILRKELRER